MTPADLERALVLALRAGDADIADDAATALRAMGWNKARIRREREKP